MHALRPQRGFTLVEVLVALVIFAFGLLAAVGLLLSSMQATQYSSNSVVASTMAREYAELMQMIPGGVSGTSSATSSSANTLMVDTDGITSGNASACTGAGKNCSATELLAAARDDWALRVRSTQALPQGRAVVCRDSTPRNAAGELAWGGRDEAGKVTPLDVKAGDVVLFGKWSGTEVKIDGEDLLIMKESDILGVIDGAAKAKAA